MALEGVDVDGDGVLTEASTDRISKSDYSFTQVDGKLFYEKENSIFATDSSDIATTVTVEKTQLSGFSGGLVESKTTVDINGNDTVSTTTIDAANRQVVKTVNVPHSDSDSVTTIVNGLKTSESNITGQTVEYEHDGLGRVSKQINPMEGEAVLTYDKLNRVVGTELLTKEGETVKKVSASELVYDLRGNVTAETMIEYDDSETATTRTTNHTYGDWGERLTSTDANNNVTTFVYDSYGKLAETIDDAGKKIRYYYDNAGQLTEQHQQNDTTWVVTKYEYNKAGQLVKEIDDQNNETITAYNSLGETISVTNPDNSAHSMTYNRLGQLATATDENGTVTAYSYDAKLRNDYNTVAKGTEVAGTDYVDFSYDSYGRLQFAENREGGSTGTLLTKVENVYNSKSLLTQEKQQIGSGASRTVGFGYDSNLNLSQVTYPSNNIDTPRVVGYNYGSLDRLKSVVEGTTTYANNSYLGFRKKSSILGNGLTRSFTYGNAGELTGIFDKKVDNSTLLSFEYGYDQVYNRLYEKRTHGVDSTGTAFGYDNLDRLTKARYNVASADTYDWQTDTATDKHDFTLDTVHNRTVEQRGNETVTYQSNALHQYSSISASSAPLRDPSYDAAGNTTLYNDFNLSYDYKNRLIAAENSEKKITFVYDVFGRRVQKTLFEKDGEDWVESTRTQFAYRGDEVIEEYEFVLTTTNYELAKSYILGESIDQPIALVVEPNATHVARTTYYYHSNAQQSIMALTDETGAIAESYSYDAYGTQTVYDALGQTISNLKSAISMLILDVELILKLD